MNDIDFEPIGKVKLSKSQYWKLKAFAMQRVALTVSIAAFILGLICGGFVGIYL